MADVILNIFSHLLTAVAGGGFITLLTVRAYRRKILGEGQVAESTAALNYHQMSMEWIKHLQSEASSLSLEISNLRKQIYELNDMLYKKDREIVEKDMIIATLRGSAS